VTDPKVKNPGRPGPAYIIGLLVGFTPWIVYGILSGLPSAGSGVAIGLALVVTVLFGYRDLKNRFILSWGTLVFFVFALIAVVILQVPAIEENMNILINAALAGIVFLSVLLGRPFTLQYAKRITSHLLWDTPGFFRVNRFMTLVWGFLFLVNLAIALLHNLTGVPGGTIYILSTVGVIVIGIIFTILIRHTSCKNTVICCHRNSGMTSEKNFVLDKTYFR
jgi:hypothetical protein